MCFHFFEGQLHVLIIVIIVEILSEVMHGKKIGESDCVVERLVLGEMSEKQRHFVHLAQRRSIQDNYK